MCWLCWLRFPLLPRRRFLEALEKQRRGNFTATEIALLEDLPKHEVKLGFAKPPAPVLEDAFEVAQVEDRMLKVWDCIQPYVHAERKNRGNENGFLNTYERFASKVKSADMRAASERLYDRGKRRQTASWLPARRPSDTQSCG